MIRGIIWVGRRVRGEALGECIPGLTPAEYRPSYGVVAGDSLLVIRRIKTQWLEHLSPLTF